MQRQAPLNEQRFDQRHQRLCIEPPDIAIADHLHELKGGSGYVAKGRSLTGQMLKLFSGLLHRLHQVALASVTHEQCGRIDRRSGLDELLESIPTGQLDRFPKQYRFDESDLALGTPLQVPTLGPRRRVLPNRYVLGKQDP